MRKAFIGRVFVIMLIVFSMLLTNVSAIKLTSPYIPVDPAKKLPLVNVEILEPVEGAAATVIAEPPYNGKADIKFHVKIWMTNNISKIMLNANNANNSNLNFSADITPNHDPIENGTPPSKTYEREWIDRYSAGQWKVVITATDERGITISDTVNFRVMPSNTVNPGPVSITSVNPLTAQMQVLLRGTEGSGNALYTPEQRITIYGRNLKNNNFLKVYLSPIGTVPDPVYNPEGGLTVSNWILYEAEILSKGTNASGLDFITVKVPKIPLSTPYVTGGLSSNSVSLLWRWVIEDTWQRPERVSPGDDIYKVYPDPFKPQTQRGTAFRLTMPEYPYVYGFGFKNTAQDANLDEFLSSYGSSAYNDFYLFKVPDPIYWLLWYPVYLEWIHKSGGSCIGMASTSLLMKNGLLDPEEMDSQVHFPAGFTELVRPAQYNRSATCPIGDYPRPKNLWAYIRANHGAQTSAEFIGELIRQVDIGSDFLHGNPNARYLELGVNPSNYIIDMINGTGGHGVVPYFTERNKISIYDNNVPNSVRKISIDSTNNKYSYTMANGEVWSGKGIYNIPLSVWKNKRTMPGLNDVDDYLLALVCGTADGFYTTSEGSWGWQKDGTFVDNMPKALALSPSGVPVNDSRTAMLIFPKAVSAPNVQINNHGGDYLFHAAQKGRIFQLEVPNSAAGDTDSVNINYENNLPASIQFTSKNLSKAILPRIGLVPGDNQRVVFNWARLTMGKGSVEFKVLNGLKGVQYKNNSDKATSHMLVIDSVDVASKSASTYVFGPFNIPSGAVQKTTIKDWPACTQLISETDLNSDGIIDKTETITGKRCDASVGKQTDKDKDGLPDQFIIK